MSERSKMNRLRKREREEKQAKNVIKYIVIAFVILTFLLFSLAFMY